MSIEPRELEKLAFQAQGRGDFGQAADLWIQLLAWADNWEHGYAHYHLADCYTRLGRLQEAENAYRRALEIEPGDPLFQETFLSFTNAREKGLI